MSKISDMKEIIYQVFPRNYSKEGTFKAITNDLERISDLGVTILYLMPINEIGIKNRKGTYGSPYASKDYYSISEDLGTLEDFKELVFKAHSFNIKVIIDMVFNHTAPDSVILNEHPEYYFYRNGKNANKVGDWTDIIDLETSREDTQKYLVNVLKYWQSQGVDGFRFDVASVIPNSFWKKARHELGKDCYFLAESVSPSFTQYVKSIGIPFTTDEELTEYFDVLYNYNYYHDLEKYLKKELPLSNLVNSLNDKTNKLPRISALENHDTQRMLSLVNGSKTRLKTLLKLMFTINGTPFIFAGFENLNDHRPELFEKDPIDWSKIDTEFYKLVKQYIKDKKVEPKIINQSFKLVDDSMIEVITEFKDKVKKEKFTI